MVEPKSVFGIPLSREYRHWHASDLARQEVLMRYGGIYLDRDMFIVKSLDPYRKYEMVLPWDEGQYLGTSERLINQTVIVK